MKTDTLTTARQKALMSAVRQLAGDMKWRLKGPFEHAGCSCFPERQRLRQLERQYEEQHNRIVQDLEDSRLGREITHLRAVVAQKDRREHPSLDDAAGQAQPFFYIWLLDRIQAGHDDVLSMQRDDLAAAYAQAWLVDGWRPKSEQQPGG